MSSMQETRENSEQKILLKLMNRLENNPVVSQRALALDLNIALGLMNAYLKRCICKGWIRVSQVPAKRLGYFLTPEGFIEKSRMVTNYLANSFSFFRDARLQCVELFALCTQRGWHKIALVGSGDLAEIVTLMAKGTSIETHLVEVSAELNDFDGVLITDILTPQVTYDKLVSRITEDRLLILDLLHITRIPLHVRGVT
ncbi:MAG: winged helix-turn-helix transcriptional regulator [Alphaproteobacteria bacterium]|nr:winged helix-turn-helix transcriptional regulator [Alphaproteobacteria bacterium]